MFDKGSGAGDPEQSGDPEQVDAGSDRLVGGAGHGTGDGQPESDPDALATLAGVAGVAGVVGCVAGVVEALDGVAGVEFCGVEGRESMGVVEALEGVRRRDDALSAVALNRLDVSGVTESVRGLRTKGWKANRCHLPHRVVARDLRIGAVLVRFEQLAVALSEAKISIDHVDAVAAVTNPRVET
ncbi:MAG: hypothetical protein ACK5O2_00725, partial [Microthrixaceae bacterium]